ncbi:alpha-2-macroglobulin-like protein 1 [Rana temporaria]|uniref:alpha-2-macroglobulin-like protein 1 n=1 Tax=Rana temporaria TaxID=8407 RepID=UPI001AAC5707|nr:alpha-2-macroglobulin-like protein 1 [Rana temporaria]
MGKSMRVKVPGLLEHYLPALCLFYLSALLGLSSTQSSINYMVLLPAQLHYPCIETACLVLDGAVGHPRIDITVTLETLGETIVIYPKDGCSQLPISCCKFKVPPPSQLAEVATVKIVAKGDLSFTETKQVFIQGISDGIVVQTDKPQYKPRDMVGFRIVTLDENFLCKKPMYSIVELTDPQNNRIAQWLKVPTRMCIAELSFKLTSDPILGTYTILVENTPVQTFIVLEKVLPRFDCTIEAPSKIYTLEDNFPVKVCARFTYGKGVIGSVSVQLCHMSYPNNICISVSGETDITGCFTTTVNTNAVAEYYYDSGYTVAMDAFFTEQDTGAQAAAHKDVPVALFSETIIFKEIGTYYRTGYPFLVTLAVTDRNGSPVPARKIELEVNYGSDVSIGTTDQKGEVTFSLQTSSWDNQVSIRPFIEGKNGRVTNNDFQQVFPFYTSAKSFLRLQPINEVIKCGNRELVQAQYIINPEDLEKGAKSVNFYYIVVGKGGIMAKGTEIIKLKDNSTLKGICKIFITFTHKFGPKPKMIGFLLLKNQMVADRIFLNLEMCFPNMATLKFSSSESLPKGKVNLRIASSAKSLCALRAVDKSVQIGFEDKELTNEMVFSLFPYSIRGGYPEGVKEENPILNCWWWWWWYQSSSNLVDVLDLFQDVGLKVLTNLQIRRPPPTCPPPPIFSENMTFALAAGMPVCKLSEPPAEELNSSDFDSFSDDDVIDDHLFEPASQVFGGYRAPSTKRKKRSGRSALHGSGTPNPNTPQLTWGEEFLQQTTTPEFVAKQEIRKYFPETWLWSLVEITQFGFTTISVTAPDTITTFNAKTFCIGNNGFGLSAQVSLTVFKPFFVDLTLPYSIIRGETVTLKSLVFNYLKQCIKVQVSLLNYSNFTVEACNDCVYTKCICADESDTFLWNITAKAIGFVPITVRAEAIRSTELCKGNPVYTPSSGNVDTVQKQLLVKAEGITKEISQNMFLCLKGSNQTIERSFVLELPNNFVKDSESAYVSVIGDLLGTALQNLNSLIVMPYGCGEQNMLTMAPIVYVLEYLTATGQLSSSLKTTAFSYLQSGYQRELNYKHWDGSFSAFGNNDGEGSTWLTAFVIKCFYQAKEYIFIDDLILIQAVSWLNNEQRPDGCFNNRGRLIHTPMKGGVNDDLSLCAFITSALLELGTPKNDAPLGPALSCLKNSISGTSNTYTLALLAYTFTLANDLETRQTLLDRLYLLGQSTGSDLHWPYSSSSSEGYVLASASVELTAYVLLALVSGPPLSTEELTTSSRIVSWLSKQQNPYGGFASTQDTVVAIQALAKYTELTFNPNSNLLVTVFEKSGSLKQFQVDKTNRLLLQKQSLPNIPGTYKLAVKGDGCIFTQIVLKYNERPLVEKSTFKIFAEITGCTQGTLYLQVVFSYNGPRTTTNMVVIEAEMLSGFSTTENTALELAYYPFVKKVETNQNSVFIYLDELDHSTRDYNILIVQDMVVFGLKPVNVKIYDYYQNEDSATTTYGPCPTDGRNGPGIEKN